MIVTADHGNCEVMVDPETGGPHTAHTLNPVPVVLVGGPPGARLRDGRLADLAPTLLAADGRGAAAGDDRAEPDRAGMRRARAPPARGCSPDRAGRRRTAPAERSAAAAARLAEAERGARRRARGGARTGWRRSAARSRTTRRRCAALRAAVTAAAARRARRWRWTLAARRDEITRLLAALQAVGRTPPPARALHPRGPARARRGRRRCSARLTPGAAGRGRRAGRGSSTGCEAARRLRARGRGDAGGGAGGAQRRRGASLRGRSRPRAGAGGAGRRR